MALCLHAIETLLMMCCVMIVYFDWYYIQTHLSTKRRAAASHAGHDEGQSSTLVKAGTTPLLHQQQATGSDEL